MTRMFNLIIASFLVLALVSCAPRTVSRDAWLVHWMKDPVCLPPCWENVNPGKTSLPDARATLPRIPGTRIISAGGDLTEFELGENASGNFRADTNGTVQMIDIHFGRDRQLSIGEVISKYGYPSEASFSFSTPQEPMFNLLYPQLGMVINTYPIENPPGFPGNPQFDIGPDEKVVGIQFVSTGLKYYLSLNREHLGPAKILNWKGYGHYSYPK